jgi:hypothetical protein
LRLSEENRRGNYRKCCGGLEKLLNCVIQ